MEDAKHAEFMRNSTKENNELAYAGDGRPDWFVAKIAAGSSRVV